MKIKTLVLPILAAGGIAMLPGMAQAQADRADVLSVPCAGCHGPNGDSQTDIPNIAGRNASFIKDAMMEFKSGAREGTVMNRIAKGYTDEEIDLIANTLGQ